MPDKPTTISKQNIVDSKIIAQLFGVTTRRVQQLAQEGIISAAKQGNANKKHKIKKRQW